VDDDDDMDGDMLVGGSGLLNIARHVIGCHSTQQTRV